MKVTATLVLLYAFGAAACGASPEYAEEPDVEAAPQTAPAAGDADEAALPPRVEAPPCGMSTRAVRSQARRNRWSGAEGFDTQNCPPAGGSED